LKDGIPGRAYGGQTSAGFWYRFYAHMNQEVYKVFAVSKELFSLTQFLRLVIVSPFSLPPWEGQGLVSSLFP
jgi:hypothetical protein